MSNTPLVERLKYWRAERPDEWTMDEFIWDAEKLEKERDTVVEALQAIKRHMEVFDIFETSSVWHIANNALTKLEEIGK